MSEKFEAFASMKISEVNNPSTMTSGVDEKTSTSLSEKRKDIVEINDDGASVMVTLE